jgi:hypothetical protein
MVGGKLKKNDGEQVKKVGTQGEDVNSVGGKGNDAIGSVANEGMETRLAGRNKWKRQECRRRPRREMAHLQMRQSETMGRIP